MPETIEPHEEHSGPAPSAGSRALLIGSVFVIVLLGLHLVRTERKLRDLEQRATLERHFWLLCHDETPPQQRTTAFLALVDAGHTEWASARTHALNLEGLDLARASLESAVFVHTRFVETSLIEARMRKSRFGQADMTGADLTRADLAGGEFYRTLLVGANLTSADLHGAVLQEADATGARFQNANLSDANLLMAKLPRANLLAANLSDANVAAADFRGSNLTLAQFGGAQIDDANFADSNWWRARGWTAVQLEMLRQRFSPGAASDAGLRDDFVLWLSGAGAGR